MANVNFKVTNTFWAICNVTDAPAFACVLCNTNSCAAPDAVSCLLSAVTIWGPTWDIRENLSFTMHKLNVSVMHQKTMWFVAQTGDQAAF